MRFAMVCAAMLAAVPAAAQDQASPWEFFEADGARNGATVKGANGTQLVLKCDKPGRREVHAILLAPESTLAAPSPRPISRPIIFQFDDSGPRTESWGFYEHYAMAQGKTSDRALARFVAGLRRAAHVELRFDTGIGPDVEMDFNVAGAEAAIARVYELCQDTPPA